MSAENKTIAVRAAASVTLPAVSMRGIVMFPSMLLHFDVGREKSVLAIKKAMEGDRQIFLVAQRDYTVEDPKQEDLYKVGVVAKIVQLLNSEKDSIRIMVEGLDREAIMNAAKSMEQIIIERLGYNEDCKGLERI